MSLSDDAGSSKSGAQARGKAVGAETRGRFLGRRAKKPRQLAVVGDACTGCSGAPVCQTTCPVEDCMVLVAAADAFPFGRIVIDPLRCVGCKKCLRDGPADLLLDGCPWDAIAMVNTSAWEEQNGTLPY